MNTYKKKLFLNVILFIPGCYTQGEKRYNTEDTIEIWSKKTEDTRS